MGTWISRLKDEAATYASLEDNHSEAKEDTPFAVKQHQSCEEEDGNGTPPLVMTGKGRILAEDPRSPTSHIDRTPIELAAANSTPLRQQKPQSTLAQMVDSSPEDYGVESVVAVVEDSPSTALLSRAKKKDTNLHKRVLEKGLCKLSMDNDSNEQAENVQ